MNSTKLKVLKMKKRDRGVENLPHFTTLAYLNCTLEKPDVFFYRERSALFPFKVFIFFETYKLLMHIFSFNVLQFTQFKTHWFYLFSCPIELSQIK